MLGERDAICVEDFDRVGGDLLRPVVGFRPVQSHVGAFFGDQDWRDLSWRIGGKDVCDLRVLSPALSVVGPVLEPVQLSTLDVAVDDHLGVQGDVEVDPDRHFGALIPLDLVRCDCCTSVGCSVQVLVIDDQRGLRRRRVLRRSHWRLVRGSLQ